MESEKFWSDYWRHDSAGVASVGPSQRTRIRLVKKIFAPFWKPSFSLLDVGCGTGEFLQAMEVWRPWGALQGADIVPQSSHIESLDVEKRALSKQFDVVSAIALIDVIKDDDAALRNLSAMIKPKGFFLVTVQHNMKYWDALNEKYGYRRYALPELARKAQRVGLEMVRSVIWGWPLYHWYYRFLIKADEGVRKRRNQRFLIRVASFFLYCLFFIDDMFSWTKKGRVIVAVFQKTP